MTPAIAKLALLSALMVVAAQPLMGQPKSASADVPDDVQQQIERVTACLRPAVVVKDDPHPCTTLGERMDQLHVRGVSIAVIHNGSVSYTHLRAHETGRNLVCRLLLE